jgi:chromosome segregation ATPase
MNETKRQSPRNPQTVEDLDATIASMEAEAAHLEAPPPEIGWDELLANSAKHEKELETRERRRGILPRLITAAKIKRLELQRERWEQEIEPLKLERDKAYERLEAAEARLTEAQRERNLALGAWSHARGLIQSRDDRIRAINRELRELQEGGR